MNTKAGPKLTLYHFDYRVAQFPFATPVFRCHVSCSPALLLAQRNHGLRALINHDGGHRLLVFVPEASVAVSQQFGCYWTHSGHGWRTPEMTQLTRMYGPAVRCKSLR